MSLPRAFLLVESGAVIGCGRRVDACDGLAPVFVQRVERGREQSRPAPLRTKAEAEAGLDLVRKGGARG